MAPDIQLKRRGLIAILDALGASTYSETEIDRFLESRNVVLEKLNKGAETGHLDKTRVHVFTFNDTLAIVYLAKEDADVSVEEALPLASVQRCTRFGSE